MASACALCGASWTDELPACPNCDNPLPLHERAPRPGLSPPEVVATPNEGPGPLPPPEPLPEAAFLVAALRLALDPVYRREEQHVSVPTAEAPRFPSTLDEIDRLGGFYGFTALGAVGGAGKSMMALRIALEAAAQEDPWRVLVWEAEMDHADVEQRVAKSLRAEPRLEAGLAFLTVIHPGRGITPETMLEDVMEFLELGDTKLLLVPDSLNTLAQLSGQDYMRSIREFTLFFMLARKFSRGHVACLLPCEIGRSGGLRGATPEHWADIDLRIQKKPEGHVELEARKMRGLEEPHLGRYVRDWRQQRFIEAGYAEAKVKVEREMRVAAGSNVVPFPRLEPEEEDLL